jgi:quercetin dioxygenase-like cupin family protein
MSSITRKEPSDIGARTQDLAGLVDYQAGAVVSRELISRPGGTVTAFAFAAGQGLSEHSAPFDALALVIDGEAEVTISSQRHILTSGKTIVMPANAPHALRALKPFKMMLIMIRG